MGDQIELAALELIDGVPEVAGAAREAWLRERLSQAPDAVRERVLELLGSEIRIRRFLARPPALARRALDLLREP